MRTSGRAALALAALGGSHPGRVSVELTLEMLMLEFPALACC